MVQVIRDVRDAENEFPGVVLTIGSFDGVHAGHQVIIKNVVDLARRVGGTPAVLTMEPHPREFFSPDRAPNLLTSLEKKIQLLAELGIEVVYVLPFDEATAAIPAEKFIDDILEKRCHAIAVIVGHDCRFGQGAKGDFQLLEREGAEHGFTVQQVAPVMLDAERVSSTLCRERVLQGDLEGIETLLGRKYSITGTVETGRGRGHELGFPTANIRPHHSAVPAQGVYVAEAIVDGTTHPAAVNIGIAPTIRHEDVTIEAHLLDYTGELVGKEVEIVFHKRLRSEKKFPTLDALKKQIQADVEAARAYFADRSVS